MVGSLTFDGGRMTSPLIKRVFVVPWAALDVTVTVFVKGPAREVSYLTIITPFSPGGIESLGNVGTVQPQVLLALLITKALFPLLVNTNSLSPFDLWAMMP